MLLVMIVTTGVVLVDVGIKILAANTLTRNLVVLPNLLELRLVHNDGIALGILSGSTVAVIVLPLVVIVCGFLLLRNYLMTNFTRVAAAFVLGGFIGNFAQRILSGYVLDMIYFPFMPWFICNVADIAICLGVGMMGMSLLFRPKDWREKHAKDKPDSAN